MYFTADLDFFDDNSVSFFDDFGKFTLFLYMSGHCRFLNITDYFGFIDFFLIRNRDFRHPRSK